MITQPVTKISTSYIDQRFHDLERIINKTLMKNDQLADENHFLV